MKEQHKLKMVIDYEAGKVPAQTAAKLLGISSGNFVGWRRHTATGRGSPGNCIFRSGKR